MPQNKLNPEEIATKLRQADVLVSQGQSVAEAVRSIDLPAEVLRTRRPSSFGQNLECDAVARLS